MRRWTARIAERLIDGANCLHLWRERAAQRRSLLTLDDRILRDIGINRAVASNEARKPFWRE